MRSRSSRGGARRKPARWADRRVNAAGLQTQRWAWRETEDSSERKQWYGPATPRMLSDFSDYVRGSWATGARPISPKEFFGEIATSRESPENTTARAFVGRPIEGASGPFWEHTSTKSNGVKRRYERLFEMRDLGPLVGDRVMRQLTIHDAQAVVWRLVRCPHCHDRAPAGTPDAQLRPDFDPFDESCPNHKAERKRVSIKRDLAQLCTLWNAARRAGLVTTNVWSDLVIPTWLEDQTNDDIRTALTWPQLSALIAAHPDDAKVIPAISAFGMMRAGECWGIRRGSLPAPPDDPEDDPECVWIEFSGTFDRLERNWRPGGKNSRAVGPDAGLCVPRPIVKVINTHLRQHMPPNPTLCEACRSGQGVWREARPNPHHDCGLADDTPLVFARRKDRPEGYGGAYYWLGDNEGCYPEVLSKAADAAGLSEQELGWRITHRAFRTTGATLLIHWGTPITEVKAAGRWSPQSTVLERTYHRMYPEALEQIARRSTRAMALELGASPPEDASEEERALCAERRIASLEAELQRLRSAADEEGYDWTTPPPTTIGVNKQDATKVLGDLEAVKSAVTAATGLVDALRRLGLSNGSAPRLRAICEQQGWDVPDGRPPNGKTDPLAQTDAVRAACEDPANRSLNAVAKALGYTRITTPLRRRLEDMATHHGWQLPERRSA